MEKIKILFVCVLNSARSQMAEAFMKKYGGNKFRVLSAGLDPGKLDLNVVEAMKEVGIDISNNESTSVFELYKNKEKFDYVITVCSKEAAEQCPYFPGETNRLHWPFDAPSSLDESRKVRDQINKKIQEFVTEF